MAHGSRGRWLRTAVTGLGVIICTTLIGCKNWDQSKDTKTATKQQPSPGLYGTPTLQQGAGTLTKGAPANTPYAGNGGNLIQQTGGVTSGGQYPIGTTGMNTNKSGPQQPFNYPADPGARSPMMGVPTQPGMGPQPSVLPGGGVGMGNSPPSGISASAPPPPGLYDVPPLPPPAPRYTPPAGGEYGIVQPSSTPPPPTLPSSPSPPSGGKGGF